MGLGNVSGADSLSRLRGCCPMDNSCPSPLSSTSTDPVTFRRTTMATRGSPQRGPPVAGRRQGPAVRGRRVGCQARLCAGVCRAYVIWS